MITFVLPDRLIPLEEMATKVSEITRGAAKVQDPLQAAESVVKELSGKVDYVVALTHQGINRDWVIARRVKGIDF
jgi:2',3'-cyclic-nucleotide 2'-phosphodiesterase (5'-nucleotidase family)